MKTSDLAIRGADIVTMNREQMTAEATVDVSPANTHEELKTIIREEAMGTYTVNDARIGFQDDEMKNVRLSAQKSMEALP